MSDALEKVSEEAMALGADELKPPDLPVAEAIMEVQAAIDFVDDDKAARERLHKTRYKAKDHARLKQLLAALIIAQSRWNRHRTGRNDQAYIDEVERAEALRARLLRAADYNCAEDRVAAGRIDAVREGEGVADLVQDLRDLAAFLEDYKALFAQDELFDLDAAQADIKERLERLGPLVSDKLQGSGADARELRDRVYTLFTRQVRAMRDAANYAFADAPATRAKFQSAYTRRRNNRARS